MDVRIYYEDTDCGGVVYYANYLKYFERARTEYLEQRGLSVAGLLQEGTQFMVVHAELDYRFPARYGETLSIETKLAGRGKATVTFAHVVREKTSGRVVVEGAATLCAVDLQGKVKRLAPAFVAAIEGPQPQERARLAKR
ncbi:acyl-CoA thioesterase [Nitrospira sp. Kam-Ns4a]